MIHTYNLCVCIIHVCVKDGRMRFLWGCHSDLVHVYIHICRKRERT